MTWRTWLRKTFGGDKTTIQRRNPLRGPERLEGREVPATLTWNVGIGTGDWNVATNWTPDAGAVHVPTLNDDVVFNNTGIGNCSLSSDAACRTLTVASNHAGMLDLGGRTLTVDDGGNNLDGTLAGGTISNGTLALYSGRLDVTGGNVNADLLIGPDNLNATANLSVSSNVGSLMATPSITIRQGGTAEVDAPSVGNSVTLSANIEVKSGGAMYFTEPVDTVTIGNGGVITVRSGGLLNLASANVLKTSSGSYIDNYGTVQKTNSGYTTVDMGLKNEASTSLLVNSGGSQFNPAYLKFTDDVANTTWSIIQTDGNIKLYNECFLTANNGYKQDGGNLRVMGSSSGKTLAGLYAWSDGEAAQINGGAVILSDGSSNHYTELDSNMTFWFSATSELRFGINSRTFCDWLHANRVEITAGATAVLTETVGNVTGKSNLFVTTDLGITGTFTLQDLTGGTGYGLQKKNNDNDYFVNT
jgi:hypothetical protein